MIEENILYFEVLTNFLVSDLRWLNTMSTKAAHSGMIIVGGGLIKHHICNANLMVRVLIARYSVLLNELKLKSQIALQRNGADFSVFLNTSSEFDGSDSGARPDEAISWGKIKKDAKPVKVGFIAYFNIFRMCIISHFISDLRRV